MDYLHYISKRILKFILQFFYFFPVQENQITLLNELSFSYGDNLKYLNEYIQKKSKGKYKVIFPLRKNIDIQTCIVVKPFSFKYFKYLLTSRVIITNAGGVSYLPLRKNQLCISTWHGGGPYKKTASAVFSNKWYRKELMLNKQNIKYILSSCELCTKLEASAMFFNNDDCINSGMPRNDIFFMENLDLRKKVFNYYDLDMANKIVLFAPTYRSDSSNFTKKKRVHITDLDFDLVKNALKAKFGGQWRFAIRFHPKLQSVRLDYPEIINCTSYPDMQELLYAADVVITDYSSLMWDFSFTKRPCFLYADDIDDYENTRGFYMSSSKWPFPIARNNGELEKNILDFDIKKYITNVKEHHRESGCFETGHACEITLKLIENNIYGRN